MYVFWTVNPRLEAPELVMEPRTSECSPLHHIKKINKCRTNVEYNTCVLLWQWEINTVLNFFFFGGGTMFPRNLSESTNDHISLRSSAHPSSSIQSEPIRHSLSLWRKMLLWCCHCISLRLSSMFSLLHPISSSPPWQPLLRPSCPEVPFSERYINVAV